MANSGIVFQTFVVTAQMFDPGRKAACLDAHYAEVYGAVHRASAWGKDPAQAIERATFLVKEEDARCEDCNNEED